MSNPDSTSNPNTQPLHVCLIAGEHSGDHMGALMMRSLKARTGGQVRFSGIGGGEMITEGKTCGFESFFPMEELSIAGIFEILPHIPNVLRRVCETGAQVRVLKPDVLMTIDSPAFAFRVGNKVKGSGIPHVHYVAPTVWAWRPGRARMIAGFLDHLLTIFPFEKAFFSKWGLDSTFVGHPTAEMKLDKGDGAGFRAAHGLAPNQLVLCVLPGSRRTEVTKHLPIFLQTVEKLRERFPDLAVVVPTVDNVAPEVKAAVADWPQPIIVSEGMTSKRDIFAAADVALAASGTVTYELAMAGVPMVIAYRMASASAAVIRMMIRIKYASVVNIVLGREVAAECLQQECTPRNLAQELGRLLGDPEARARQRADLCEVAVALGRDMAPASETATDALMAVVARKRANV
ncbi:MAG: lipid-A-disaccharide synthase [Alphaproteobacteria bacterium]